MPTTTVTCPMCRTILDPDAQGRACRHCPLHHLTEGCAIRMIRCPACGYHSLADELAEGPVDSEVVDRSGRPSRARSSICATCRLSQLHNDADAVVTGFNGLSERATRRLMAYGLVPGARFRLLQRRPAYILRLGETELALEPDLAESVYVEASRSSARPSSAARKTRP